MRRFKICMAIDKEKEIAFPTELWYVCWLQKGGDLNGKTKAIRRRHGAQAGGRPWEGRIVVGHKKNGAPLFQHTYARTQKELTEKLHRNMERYQDVELTADSRMTLGEWLDRWLTDYKENTVRPGTLAGYRSCIENYIKPQLGGKQVSLVTSQDVQKLYRKLKENGRVREHPRFGYALSDTTINRLHAIFHQAMEDALHAHIIAKNPTVGATVPKASHAPKRVLTDKELDTFLDAVREDRIWGDFFYVELTTGLRRGEICGLMWQDFDARNGVLQVRRTLHNRKLGVDMLGKTKTRSGERTIVLPRSTAEILRRRKENAITQWIFPDPVRPELPLSPNCAYTHMKAILHKAGLPDIRFLDLRHTFATHAIASGVDAKTLSGILGHTNASFTLDIYTHITGDMQRAAAASIDRSIGKAEPQEEAEPERKGIVDFQPYVGKKRKPGTGCVTEINDHLFEGRYSPVWPDGTQHSRNVYARTREECEEKLKTLITEMNEERKNLKEQLTGIAPPEKLTKKQRKLWDYMRLHPEVTEFSTIAKRTGLARNTVKKHYGVVAAMLGRK